MWIGLIGLGGISLNKKVALNLPVLIIMEWNWDNGRHVDKITMNISKRDEGVDFSRIFAEIEGEESVVNNFLFSKLIKQRGGTCFGGIEA